MDPHTPISSSNLIIGAANKKVFCNLCGSHISPAECAYSTITHDPRLPSTPPVDPCGSCKVYVERTDIYKKTEDITKTSFNKKVLGELDFVLVGLGEKREHCGKFFASRICQILYCMKVHYTKQSCMRKACPECWTKWMVEERENIMARLLSEDAIIKNAIRIILDLILSPDPIKWQMEKKDNIIALLLSKDEIIKSAKPGLVDIILSPDKKKWPIKKREDSMARLLSRNKIIGNAKPRLVDIILSPDPKIWPKNEDEFEKLLKSGYRYIRRKGAKGGCSVIHPFRATKEAKRLSFLLGVKTWEWIREQENPDRYRYYSPHLHLLAYVGHMKEPKEGEKWLYITKEEKTEDEQGNEKWRVIDFLRMAKRGEVLRKRINYFLSHTGTLKKEEGMFHSVRWFGTLSYNQLEITCEELMERGDRKGLKKRCNNCSYFHLEPKCEVLMKMKMKMEEREREEMRCKICGGVLMPFWSWVSRSFGDVLRDILNNVLDPPPYWKEVVRTVEGYDPPEDAEEYLI